MGLDTMTPMVRRISGIFLGLAGGLHLVRVFAGWDLVLDECLVPVWLSIFLGVVLLFLAWANLFPT